MIPRALDHQGYVSAQDPRTFPASAPLVTPAIRSLQNETNMASQGSVAGDNPESKFGLALMQLLKQHQSLGTAPLESQQLNLSDSQAQAGTNAALDPSLQGYASGVISGARGSAEQPYGPLIQGSGQNQQTLGEQIRGLGTGIEAAQSFLKTNIDQQNKSRDDARNLIHQSFVDFGGSAFDKIKPEEAAALEKAAGLPKGYIQSAGKTIKERELELKKQHDADVAAQKEQLNGLTRTQINNTVNQIAQAFDNEAVVKNYNTIAEAVNFVKNSGMTPTDDIGRIYQFAKIMDPSSAVREGEYKTVQDYATSLLQRFGLKSKRVFTNSGFLTDEARKFLLDTLNNRLKSSETNYKNVYNQYQKRLSAAKSGQMNSITDYGQAFGNSEDTVGTGNNSTTIMTGPGGTFSVPNDKVDLFRKNGYK